MTPEWRAPAVVLDARPHGEGGAVVTVMTADHGRHAGFVHGGGARAQAGLWQPGNMVEARWAGRQADSLGTLAGEMVHPAAALAMDDPLALATLAAACAVAETALPEREPHPGTFHDLVALVSHLGAGPARALPDLVRWEATLLRELGYGLDLARCAVTGAADDLAFVSPRTGRAVARGAAGAWRDRLLVLPACLLDPGAPAGPAEWLAGLRLTGHFLGRDAYGQRHRPLPPARILLQDRVAALAAPPDGTQEGPAETDAR